jgi:hypothetical protein
MLRELIALSDVSRVWLYQANRELTYDEIDQLRPAIFNFVSEWSSHKVNVPAYGNIFHKRFIGFFADESQMHGVSGCSIDSSVQFIRQISSHLNVDFFDRLQFAYLDGEEVKTVHQSEMKKLYENNNIDDETLFFDNLVSNKADFLEYWLKPLKSSWHNRMIK